MTTYLDKVHFRPRVRRRDGMTKPSNTLACGRIASMEVYMYQASWDQVDCPACLAALKGKEELDDGSVRSDEVA
jgi:hypothetical protein